MLGMIKDTIDGKTSEQLFELIDKMHTGKYQRYDTKYMIDSWLSTRHHRSLLLPTYVNDLFVLLDRELLVGAHISQFEPYPREGGNYIMSGILGDIPIYGTGDYYDL